MVSSLHRSNEKMTNVTQENELTTNASPQTIARQNVSNRSSHCIEMIQ